MPPPTPKTIADLLDTVTLLSLGLVLVLLGSAYGLSLKALERSAKTSTRILFIWHIFSGLIHFVFEGSFLFNVFFSSAPFDPATRHLSTITNFLGRSDRLYGAAHADNWASKLWMVYAAADKRWAEADLTVVSLEVLTVVIGGPLAIYIAYSLARNAPTAKFWMTILATGELYGGFMTFAPEWLTGSPNLDTSNFMFLWVYLFFFNMLWVVFPIYALWVASWDIGDAFQIRAEVQSKSDDKVAKKRKGSKGE
ncbi:Emopamil-binding protein [Bisporella sp. PMI_857]|nr:Emopamil-binding protein [Bisporella sp. PMI_857]